VIDILYFGDFQLESQPGNRVFGLEIFMVDHIHYLFQNIHLNSPRHTFRHLYSIHIWQKELSESYVRTDGQSASLSWNKAAIWGL
jgi:hypothetical protein